MRKCKKSNRAQQIFRVSKLWFSAAYIRQTLFPFNFLLKCTSIERLADISAQFFTVKKFAPKICGLFRSQSRGTIEFRYHVGNKSDNSNVSVPSRSVIKLHPKHYHSTTTGLYFSNFLNEHRSVTFKGVVNANCQTLRESETSVFLCQPDRHLDFFTCETKTSKCFKLMRAWDVPTLFKLIYKI